jgi:hypothetical protein
MPVQIAAIVTTSVVLETRASSRAKVIEKWIEVGLKCLELDNVSSLHAIGSVLAAHPLYRFPGAWSVRRRPRASCT